MMKLLAAALLTLVAVPASATIVSGTFSGQVTYGSNLAPVGSTYSGTWKYDTDAPLTFGDDTYYLANNSISITIGGVTYTNQNIEAPAHPDLVSIVNFGNSAWFEIGSQHLVGPGALEGASLYLQWKGVTDPTVLANQLPMTIPDFTNTTLTMFKNGSINGTLDFTVDAAAVPEPAMLGLFGLGAIGLGVGRRRKA